MTFRIIPKLKPVALFAVILCIVPMTFSITASAKDSPSPKDTLQVVKYLHLGEERFNSNIDSASYYFLKAGVLARKVNYKKGITDFISYYVRALNRQGKYEEALKLGREALQIAQELKNPKLIATAFNNMGNEYSYLGDLHQAASYYLRALQTGEKINSPAMMQKFCNNLASVFSELKNKEKSKFYAEKSYKYALLTKDSSSIASSLVNLANSEVINGNLEKGKFYLNKLVKIAVHLEDITYILDAYINLGHISTEQKNYKEALDHFKTALIKLNKEKIPDYQLYVHWGLAQSYYYLKSYNEANKNLLISVEVGKSISALNELRQLYDLGAKINEELNNISLTLDYLKKYNTLNDSIVSTETQQNIHKLEIEYQTSLKEKAIAEQKLTIAQNEIELQQKNKWIFVSGFAIVILALTILISYLIYKNKQKAVAERMNLLEKERQVQVLEAMITGEEKERSRLAKDLHDGIGGILSATKMHLSILKNEQMHNNITKFEQTLGMLDSASKEIRSISHNLAPEILISQGLDIALSKFCERVNNSSLHINYYCIGEVPRLKSNFELIVYRIVQELVNNIIKHSQASNAVVQLSFHEDFLTLTVEDNGVGMERGRSEGIGMTNLESRVKAVNGDLNITSESGNGTTFYIEFDTTQFKVQEIQKVEIY